MRTNYDIKAMARDLAENGFDAEQAARYDLALEAAKVAAVAVLCARYGAVEGEVLEALMDSRSFNCEVYLFVACMEASPAFVAFVHSGHPF
jgi:hypothetical protein